MKDQKVQEFYIARINEIHQKRMFKIVYEKKKNHNK